jgi:small subunit ribosomal protein S18
MSDRLATPNRRGRPTVRRVRVNPVLNGVDRVDWKDVDFLREFLGDRAKIAPRRVSRASARAQRQIRVAIKRARQMALLPYA